MLQKLLADSVGYLLVLVGLVTVVTVGVMSILLPFFVFRIMNQLAGLTRKMDRIIDLLHEQGRERQEAVRPAPPDSRLGPTAPRQTKPDPVGDKPLRFK